jgi:hypothetical protein
VLERRLQLMGGFDICAPRSHLCGGEPFRCHGEDTNNFPADSCDRK